MYNRFAKTQKIINNSDEYAEYFRQRNMKDLKQYSTFNFSNLKKLNLKIFFLNIKKEKYYSKILI